MAENNLDASKIPASGPKGNIVKADVVKAASQGSAQTSVAMAQPEGQLFALRQIVRKIYAAKNGSKCRACAKLSLVD